MAIIIAGQKDCSRMRSRYCHICNAAITPHASIHADNNGDNRRIHVMSWAIVEASISASAVTASARHFKVLNSWLVGFTPVEEWKENRDTAGNDGLLH